MKVKYNRLISFMLFILIVFSGMCTQGLRADSLFEYTAAHREQSHIVSADAKEHNRDGCTIEMLSRIGETYISSAAKRSGDRNSRELSQLLLCTLLGSNTISNTYAAVQILRIPKLHTNTVILKYIHNKDGKK